VERRKLDEMKKLKLLLTLVALSFCMTACGDDSGEGEFLEVQDYSGEEEGKEITLSSDLLEFVMDADTTQFSITNKVSGQTWFSNPQTAEYDSIANGINKTMLLSTLIVKYSDSKGQDFTYDNYSYSIKEKRYSVEVTKDENGTEKGVKILYTIGASVVMIWMYIRSVLYWNMEFRRTEEIRRDCYI